MNDMCLFVCLFSSNDSFNCNLKIHYVYDMHSVFVLMETNICSLPYQLKVLHNNIKIQCICIAGNQFFSD